MWRDEDFKNVLRSYIKVYIEFSSWLDNDNILIINLIATI